MKFIPSRTLTLEEATDGGYSSSFLRTVSRCLDNKATECFRAAKKKDFTPRWPNGEEETKYSLRQAGDIHLQNSRVLRGIANKLKGMGR